MAVSTIKSSGGDYSTLSAWEAAQAATLTAPAEAECYDFALDEGTGVVISGITTSASNYIRIYTALGEGHDGRFRSVSGSGFKVTGSGSAGTIRDTVQHLRLEGLEIENTGTGPPVQKVGPYSSGANDHRIERCILHDVGTGASNTLSVAVANLRMTVRNTIVVGSRRSIDTRGTAAVELSNCTFWRRADQLGVVSAGEATIRNCYSGKASGTQEDFWTGGAAPTGNNNASSDSSASTDYANSVTSVAGSSVFTSVTSGSEDFTLKPGTNALVDVGADLSGSFTVDIIGTTRPQGSAFDIGAFERIVGGGTTTLTADPGSITITGTAASLEFNRRLAAAAGSVAITGTAASLEFNRKLAAATGSFAVSGTAASLEHNRRLSAEAGSFQISGTAAALLKNSRLAAGSGSYIITGTDATLSKEGEIRLSADPGSVVITGTAADLIYNSLTPAARTVPPAGGGSDNRRGARRRRVPYVLPDGRRIRLYPEEIADLVARGRLPATQRPVRPRPSVAALSPASEPAPIVLPPVRDRSADIERLMAEARTAGRLADMVAGMAEGLSAAMAAERAAEDQRRRRRRRAAALLLLQ